jgi:hypothetical protein
MTPEMETLAIINAAQYAGSNGGLVLAGMMIPGWVAAGFCVLLVIAFGILLIVFEHFTEDK